MRRGNRRDLEGWGPLRLQLRPEGRSGSISNCQRCCTYSVLSLILGLE